MPTQSARPSARCRAYRPGRAAWLVSIVAALGLAACTTTPEPNPGAGSAGSAGTTPDERLLNEQSEDFVSQNVFEGAATNAALGCVLGAVIGLTMNGEAQAAAKGCAIGGVAGGIYGGVDGYLNAKEAQYKTNEAAKMRSMAADAREDTERLAELLETSQRVVENDKRKLEDLRAQVDAKQISVEQARAEAASVRRNSDQIETILADAREKRDNYVAARDSLQTSDTAELDAEIGRLETEIAALETQLAAVNSSLQLNGLG